MTYRAAAGRREDDAMPLGMPEMIVIAVIALLVLGPKRLPEAGRGVGKSIREFKDALTGGDDEGKKAAAKLDAPADV
jgi:sec-independent protein translocase protein TatA